MAEAWTSYEGLRPLDDFKSRLDQVVAMAKGGPDNNYAAQLAKWYQANDPGTAQGWSNPAFDTSSWKTVKMPQPFESSKPA